MSRLRCRPRPMSIAVAPATIPNLAAWRTRSATFALQTSFLLGRQLMFGQEPPIHFRSTTAVRLPELARCQARSLPPAPLPRTSASYRWGSDMLTSSCETVSDLSSFSFGACREELHKDNGRHQIQ